MFSWFRKKERSKAEKPGKKAPMYIYRPCENAMSFRVEFRDEKGYVYPGWSKAVLYIIEGDAIYSADDNSLVYILKEKQVYDASGERPLFWIGAGAVYALPGQRLMYNIRDSIAVQGTL